MAETTKGPPPSAKGDEPTAKGPESTDESIAQGAQESKPNYWAIVPASVRYDKELPANAKLLYGELSALTQAEGYCWASNAYFASLYDLTEDRISRLLVLLERRGYITREIVRDEETNAVIGRKIWLYQMAAVVSDPPGKNTGASRQKYRDPPGKNTGKNNINNNTIPPIVPQRGKAKAGERFENFWKLYPPRGGRRNGKAQAKTQWERLGVETDAAMYEKILSGLDAYKSSPDVQRGYAVDACRWLRNRRWEDEACAPDVPAPVSWQGDSETLDAFSGSWY